ncbi:uncharacterized protein LACBIDRAFT_325254 [Laccaria bicolor S238N-H82]|uniref:Predicted protein n=1 Tax=Laccaria bicolor (strain S238N-H82 / ATCC MYA-4686) TaxID=486041 RepID=B0D4B9_LACBS|nr:uncharacterized protein LACBIDRAFT_325254 [Laccaria bicolor S238N-H82]EDR10307.1 predicted protein [Laccaria bicolor S238N-H82]|eukprot:XP_001878757.1 predicted protein [Laccaria bicolor S238N-H82]
MVNKEVELTGGIEHSHPTVPFDGFLVSIASPACRNLKMILMTSFLSSLGPVFDAGIITRRLVFRTPRLSDTSLCIAFCSDPPNFVYEPVKSSENLRKTFVVSPRKGEHAQLVFITPTDPTAPLWDEKNKPIQQPIIERVGSKEARKEVASMAFGEYGADIVQLEITPVNGPFDSFMRRNFEEFKGWRAVWEKVWEIWRAEWELKTLKAKKASRISTVSDHTSLSAILLLSLIYHPIFGGMASANAIVQTNHHEGILDFSKSFSSRREATLANGLPRELLACIFETAQNMLLPSGRLFRRFPFILGGVSWYWRKVAFTEPKLWLNVDISHPRNLTALQGYLARSKRYPIDLNLFYDNALSADVIFVNAEVTQLIDILQPHYRRCRSIKFLATCPERAAEMEMVKILTSMSNSDYPMLKRFLVQLPEMGDELRPQSFRYEAPNLTSVFLRGLGLSYCRPPFNAVTELHLAVENNTIEGCDFFDMLRGCAKTLITLCIYDDLVLTWPTINHSIAMPFLRQLRIFGTMHKVSELLLLISAPNLEELTIAPIISDDLSILSSETTYNNPKFPALKSLTLAPAYNHSTGLTLTLASACFPGIGLLILPNDHQFLREEFSMENAKPRWPQLHSLAVRDIGHDRYEESTLYTFVEDRQRLEHLYLIAIIFNLRLCQTMCVGHAATSQNRKVRQRNNLRQPLLNIYLQGSSIGMATFLDDSEITRNLSDLEVSSADGKAALANELPPELLVYIFEIAQNMLPPSEHLFRHFPLILGGVSHYWREVAFGAPMLWSNVDISHPRNLAVLRTYLNRSKDYPIDLHLTYDITRLAHDGRADPRDVDQLIVILQPHYFHCRSIRLSSGTYYQATPEMFSLLKSMRDGHYPMLQSFFVEGDDKYDTTQIQSCTIFNDAAPNLTNVRLAGFGFSYCRPPLKAVTELHLAVELEDSIIPFTDFSKMLRSCESLITLCIYDDLVHIWPSDLEELTIAPIAKGDLTILRENNSDGAAPSRPRWPELHTLADQLAVVEADPWQIQRGDAFYSDEQDRFLGSVAIEQLLKLRSSIEMADPTPTDNSGAPDFPDSQKATLADELPPEILVYIFEMARNTFLPEEEHLLRRFPLVLGMVSQYWRQVAYGAPMLWSNVYVSHERDLDGLQVYLGRSRDLPIDLHVAYDDTSAPGGERDVSMLISTLRLHYPRCRSIRLKAPHKVTPEIMSILGSMCEGRYPTLQRFHVEGTDTGELISEPRAIVADAPNLTSIRLRGLGLTYCRPPLTAATELHLAISINTIPYTYFYAMLGSCQSLITLCVYDDLVFGWPINLRTAHDMPSLRYLRIFGNMLGVSQLLLSISAPCLKELTIAPVLMGDLELLLVGASRNAPRFPALKSLTLAPAHADAMESTLRLANTCFPGIKLLVLPNYYKGSFIESFKTEGHDTSEQLWPELDGLAVRDIDEGQDQGVLYEFIKFRQLLGVPLGTLYLDSSSMPRMTRMDWLKDRLSVVEADPWKIQCQNAFYSNEEDRFLGAEE